MESNDCNCNECIKDLYRNKALQELEKKINTVDANGKIKTVSKVDILVTNLVNKATKGNKDSIELLIKMGVFEQ